MSARPSADLEPPAARERPCPVALVSRLVQVGAIILLCLAAAELASRLEDLAFDGTSFLANPTPDSELVYTGDDGVTRGRPGGRYGRWRLNRFGFRGPDISAEPARDTVRIMVLGSSEAFGLYEPDGKEFPRQLAERLSRRGGNEVVNASLFGMTLRSMAPFWNGWARRFQPRVVVIYPSPLFYLQDTILSHRAPAGVRGADQQTTAPDASPAGGPTPGRRPEVQSRFVNRLRDVVDLPDVVQRRRDQRQIAGLTANRPPGWLFTSVPADRIALLVADLTRVVQEAGRSAAVVVLTTHAFRCATPPTRQDLDALDRARVHGARATPDVMHAFHRAANEAIARVGADHDLVVADADRALSGRPEYFGDLIHFNELGSARMADLLADRLVPLIARIQGEAASAVPAPPLASVAATPGPTRDALSVR